MVAVWLLSYVDFCAQCMVVSMRLYVYGREDMKQDMCTTVEPAPDLAPRSINSPYSPSPQTILDQLKVGPGPLANHGFGRVVPAPLEELEQGRAACPAHLLKTGRLALACCRNRGSFC